MTRTSQRPPGRWSNRCFRRPGAWAGASCTGALIYRAPKSGGGFPERFRGGLFYADYNRKSVRFAPVDAQTLKPGASEAFVQGLPGGLVALRQGPDGARYLVEYGGWFQAATSDVVSRIFSGRDFFGLMASQAEISQSRA